MATGKNNAAKTNGFENPYRAGGNYHACVEVLMKLGIGKFHHADVAINAVRKLVKTTDEKALCNLQVICRTADYGRPLLAAGFIARKERTEKGQFFGLFKFDGRMPAQADWMTTEKPKAKKAPKAKGKKAK